MGDIDKCIEINIAALKEAGYELTNENIEELKKVIKHSKGKAKNNIYLVS